MGDAAMTHEDRAGAMARRGEGVRHPGISPSRRALNPILYDGSVMERDVRGASVFLTPASGFIQRHLPLIIAGGAGAFLLAGFVASRLGAPAALTHLLTLCAFAIGAIPSVSSVWESLRQFRIDIDTLMVLGAGLAVIIGSPMEGALLLFLFALSGAMEEFALGRTQEAIVSLHRMMPTQAMVLEEAGPRRMTLNRVPIGARVLVRPGDTVPLDGEVIEGRSAVNEAAITGESLPADKHVGDRVFAGTSNVNGRLVVRVTKRSADTTLAKILRLVTEARQKRAGVQRLIDRIGPTYSMMVIVGSVLAGVVLYFAFDIAGKESVRRGIAVLIVCSPCALIIATPVAYMAAIGAAALRGVLIKGGAYLETLARSKTIVFDKTGTLTTGEIQLVGVETFGRVEEAEALRIAGAVESSSSHPLARAVMNELKRRSMEAYDVSEVDNVAGEGISADVRGRRVWIGRPSLAGDRLGEADREAFERRAEEVHQGGRAASALIIDGAPGLLVFADSLRAEAGDTLRRLRAAGVTRIEMLTGDHRLVAEAMTKTLDIDGYRAELLPEQKQGAAEQLRAAYGSLVMVGDGVNDAPALAAADVGIAIGSIGADVALEAADIVLMNDSLEGVSWVYGQAQRTARIVRQNLTVAIGVIVVLAGFALAGKVALPLAVVGHEGSTVLVALNALRLLSGSRRGPNDSEEL